MFFKKTKYFFFSYAIFFLISLVILLIFSKIEIQIAVNKFNSPFLDVFFKYTSYLGIGGVFVPLFLATIFKHKKFAFKILLSGILMATIIYIAKWSFNATRPVIYFQENIVENYNFHFVEGVKLLTRFSFPSGHTATAFTFFLLIALFFNEKNKFIQIICITLAILVGYSRMYLMQHFLIDVFFGSIIGILCVICADFIINKIYINSSLNF